MRLSGRVAALAALAAATGAQAQAQPCYVGHGAPFNREAAAALPLCEPATAAVLRAYTVVNWVVGRQPVASAGATTHAEGGLAHHAGVASLPGSLAHQRPAAAAAAAAPAAPPAPLPVVTIVSHREFILGCHSFDKFFSERMPVYFVFSREFADGWRIPHLVSEHAPSTVQLLITQRLPGEILARGLVTSLIEATRGDAPAPEFLFFAHCDIHVLPPPLPRGLPTYEAAIEQLAADFQAEKRLRKLGRTNVKNDGTFAHAWPDFWRGNETCYHTPAAERARMPVYAMNTVLLESVRAWSHLEGSVFHGVDVGGFMAHAGLRTGAQPRADTNESTWLSDAGSWLEDHAIMYDYAMYRQFQAAFPVDKAGDVLFHNEFIQPELLCRLGWTAVRDNEVFLHYSTRLEDDTNFRENNRLLLRQKTEDMAKRDGLALYSDVYSPVDIEWLRSFQLELLYARVSPAARFREHTAATALLKSSKFVEWGNNVVALFIRASMLPARLLYAPAHRATVGDLMDDGLGALFGVVGYELASSKGKPKPVSGSGSKTSDLISLRRTAYPLSRYFHVTVSNARHTSSYGVIGASTLPPPPCRKPLEPYKHGGDVDGCTLFLALELPEEGKVVAVYAANYKQLNVPKPRRHKPSGGSVGRIASLLSSASSASGSGPTTSVAPRTLRLPRGARVLKVGSPIVGQPGRSASSDKMLALAHELCSRSGVTNLHPSLPKLRDLSLSSASASHNIFLPKANQTLHRRVRLLPALLGTSESRQPWALGMEQGVPPVPLRDMCGMLTNTVPSKARLNNAMCSMHKDAPRWVGEGPTGSRQYICCSMEPCHPCDIHEAA